jgi:hypothetical protein
MIRATSLPCRLRSATTTRSPNRPSFHIRFGPRHVEYPWHPLHGRRLRVREGARRGHFDIVLVEDRPGRRRELPRWMCDRAACAGMGLGAPQVTLDALLKLASILRELSERGRSRSSSGCPASQEVPDVPPPLAIADAADADPRARAEPGAKGTAVGGSPAAIRVGPLPLLVSLNCAPVAPHGAGA